MNISNKKILITGPGGLLGTELIQRLNDFNIIHTLGSSPISDSRIRGKHFSADFSKNWSSAELPNDIDVIIHLSQSEKFKNFPSDSLEVFNINLSSTVKLLDFALNTGISKFIFASTGGVYRPTNEILKINSMVNDPKNLNFYAGTKLASEIFINNYRSYFQIDILRIFFMYGPSQKQHMLIPKLINSVAHKKEIMINGDSGILINPIYVSDVAKVVSSRIYEDESEVINVCGSEILSIRQIASEISQNVGVEPIFRIKEPSNNLLASPERVSQILNHKFIKFSDGLKRMI